MKRIALLVAAPALLAALPSRAVAEVEVGGIAGVHIFSKTNALGVPEGIEGEDAPSQRNSALFGARLGAFFGMFGVEAELGVIPSEPRELLFSVVNLTYRAQLVAQFRAQNPNVNLIPFAFAGAGMLQVVDTQNEDIIVKDKRFAPFVGIGAKYRAGHDWGVRLDARVLLVPSSKEGGGQTTDFEALFAVYKEIGRKHAAKPTTEEPPKTDDPDKDEIVGKADSCPDKPEDKDGFKDEDGCPDDDNDEDGIADATDKCKDQPEDKDSFEDDDGCPDVDNDGDKIPDAADKCSDKPETANGFEDDDGCPDEIPQAVKDFTGKIEGIAFKVSSADLAPTSKKVLDKAVAVLVEFKQVKLQIEGHTDDQPLKGNKKFKDNTELSQARAESVKAYFVSKGVEADRLVAKGFGDSKPVTDPKGLKGAALNKARAGNRRVEFTLVTGDEGGTKPPPADEPKEPAEKPADAPKENK